MKYMKQIKKLKNEHYNTLFIKPMEVTKCIFIDDNDNEYLYNESLYNDKDKELYENSELQIVTLKYKNFEITLFIDEFIDKYRKFVNDVINNKDTHFVIKKNNNTTTFIVEKNILLIEMEGNCGYIIIDAHINNCKKALEKVLTIYDKLFCL